MKELKIKRQSKIKDFIKGKGFYLSLTMSLALVGSAIWIGMNKSIDRVIDENMDIIKNSSRSNTIKTVDNIVSNVPISKQESAHSLGEEEQNIDEDNQDDQKEDEMGEGEMTEEENQESEIPEKEEDISILFMPPLVGKIINKFSNYELVKNQTLSDWRTHNGIDIAASQGTPVKSIADGEVIKIYSTSLMGTCIDIEHPGNINSIYCGLNKNVNVKEGDKIEAGSVIGSVGKAVGEAELAPHLHLELKKDGVKIDPLTKIKMP